MTRIMARVWLRCVLLAAVLYQGTARPTKYVEDGKTLKLRQEIPPDATSVLWKHGRNKVAEFDKNFGEGIDYYGIFVNRTNMVPSQGTLTVDRVNSSHAGTYSVEVNGKPLSEPYQVEVIKQVPAPHVRFQPLACGLESKSCNLACESDTTKAGPVTYAWRKDDGPWMSFQSNVQLINNDEEMWNVGKLSCKVSNPISATESAPVDNPFHKSHSNAGLVVGLVFLVVLISIIGVIIWKRKWIMAKLPSRCRKRTQPQNPGEADTLSGDPEGGQGNNHIAAPMVEENRAENPNGAPGADRGEADTLLGDPEGRQGNNHIAAPMVEENRAENANGAPGAAPSEADHPIGETEDSKM